MQAFARGFVPVQDTPLLAEAIVTDASIKRAKGDEAWGSVFLLEVPRDASMNEALRVSQPLLLTDVMACWAPSVDAALDIEARMETFDDTVPAALEIKTDPSLFSEGGGLAEEQPGLAFSLGDSPMQDEGNQGADEIPSIDSTALEKLAGAIASIGSLARRGSAPITTACELLSLPEHADASRSSDALTRFAHHAYRAVHPGQAESGDERIYITAATMLHEVSTKDGIDPISFVEQLLAIDSQQGHQGAEVEAFLDTLRKVLDNRIELSDSKIDDTGGVGQRALMIFLLAPRAEQLQRWVGARPVGKGVAILASILSGLYCGLGGISREAKGPTRSAFLGAITAARFVVEGKALQVHSTRRWDEAGNQVERVGLAGFDFIERTLPASGAYAELLQGLRAKRVLTGLDPNTGVAKASLGADGVVASAQVDEAKFRLPHGTVARLALKAKLQKRGQPPRELLASLLDRSLRPVVPSVDPATGEILLEVEVDLGGDPSLALSALQGAMKSLGLVPVVDPELVPAEKPKRASRKPKAAATDEYGGQEG